MILLLKLAVFLVASFGVGFLRRSKHPLARKLLVNISLRTDYQRMSAAQVRDTARSFLFLSLAAGAVAALLLFTIQSRTPQLESLGFVGGTVIALTILGLVLLLSAGYYGLLAFNKSAAERRAAATYSPPRSLRPS